MARILRQTDKTIELLREGRQPLTDQCGGCKRIIGFEPKLRCDAYAFPAAAWRMGHCPLATHVSYRPGKTDSGKVRVGQQKQKKKSRR